MGLMTAWRLKALRSRYGTDAPSRAIRGSGAILRHAGGRTARSGEGGGGGERGGDGGYGSGGGRGGERGHEGGEGALGIAQVIASVMARLRAGGTLIDSFEEESPEPFATRALTFRRLSVLLNHHRGAGETERHANEAAAGLLAAARLSEELGCPASPCLNTVLESYTQMRAAEDLQMQAFAVPKATIGLLSALPLATLALGELLGARPIAFLFGSPRGLPCLMLGLCWYAAGLSWVRMLLRKAGEQ